MSHEPQTRRRPAGVRDRVLQRLAPNRRRALSLLLRSTRALLTGHALRRPSARAVAAPPPSWARDPGRRRSTAPPAPGDLTREADAELAIVRGGGLPPYLLAYYPHYATNPYQALTYSRFREAGIAPVRVRSPKQLDEVTAIARAGVADRTILHLHWLQLVIRGATSPKEAAARVDRFLAWLDDLRAAGGRIAWTVHNILPHETAFEAQEVRLSQGVADRAHVLHVLSAATPDLVAPWYRLAPERVLHVPHPSYAGAYPDVVGRLEARARLGLDADSAVVALLGAIRPYKGLDDLLAAWSARPLPGGRLLVAGSPSDEPGVRDVLGRVAADPSIRLDARLIPAPEMQVFLRASDVAVFPYHGALNSGAVLLALTFGVPAIVPSGTGLVEVVSPDAAEVYDPSREGALTEALLASARLMTDAARSAAFASVADLIPAAVSTRLAAGLRERLGE